MDLPGRSLLGSYRGHAGVLETREEAGLCKQVTTLSNACAQTDRWTGRWTQERALWGRCPAAPSPCGRKEHVGLGCWAV